MSEDIKISSNQDLEKIFTEVGLKAMEIKGKGFYNKLEGIVGITLFPDNKPENIIDIFLKINSNELLPE